MKNVVFWDVTPLALVRTEVSKERIASIITVTIIGEPGTALAVTSNQRSQLADSCQPVDGGDLFLRDVSYCNSHTA
jgi:hypothetical protein